jgi:subtilase family serine protease
MAAPVAAAAPVVDPTAGGDVAAPPLHVHPLSGPGPSGYSPAQIRHAYGLDQLSQDGTNQTIAIVDAYNDPHVSSDLHAFDVQFGLADPKLTVVNQSGGTRLPSNNAGWALEIALDVEWAHAVAPKASILLVEASSATFGNLLTAVSYASSHAHVVSMSWGGSDFSGESSFDTYFKNKPGVTFTAASGDNGTGVIYPAASPYVLAVGGTSLHLDSTGNLTAAGETAWSGSGGGISGGESEPSYQSGFPIPSTNGKRGAPDVSYNADPNTGFAVYDSYGYGGWVEVGGTSAGAPQWAALTALANQTRVANGLGYLSSSSLTASPEYAAATGSTNYAANYRDITSGSNGSGPNTSATTGYDFVTGLGSPLANQLVPYLASH